MSVAKFRALALQGYSGVAHNYCRDIVSGKIPACLFIKQSCQATLDDLTAQSRKGSEYFYDAPVAERACEFIELLPHVKGKWAKLPPPHNRLHLEPWQIWLTCRLLGWKSKQTRFRRFTELYAEIPRKNAKTTWAAALAVYLAFADGEFGAEVYCGASKLEQAMILFDISKLQVIRTPDLQAALDIEDAARSLWRESDGSKFMAVVGDPGDGNSPSVALLDELHQHPTSALRDAMETGFGAREQPLMLQITTAGVDNEGPCWSVRERSVEVLKGEANGGLREDSLFAAIYTIDEGDEPLTIESLRKANPNYGVSVMEAFLLRQIAKAKHDSGEAYVIKTKHLNVWAGVKESYFNTEEWRSDRCLDRTLKLEAFEGRECYEGLDLASREDLVSAVLVFPELRHTGPIDERTSQPRLERHYTVFGRHYSPRAQVYDGSHKNYVGWHESGWLIAHDGVEVKLALVQEDIEADLTKYSIKRLAFDKAYARQMQQDLEEKTPTDTVMDCPQTAQFMSDAMKEIRVAIKAGRVHHAGDPVFAWCMGNVVSKRDTNGNDKADKKDPKRKIDAASAFINAMTQAYSAPLAPPRRFTSPHIGYM